MKFKKLDRRMRGFGDFLYVADFPNHNESQQFAQARAWCASQWGASVELDIWYDYDGLKNPLWCWERGEYNTKYRCRIYIVTEEDAAVFKLTWK